MKVPLLDLKRQYQTIKPELDAAILNVMAHTQFILGPEVKQFEEKAAAFCGTKHAIGVASGTDALLLALRVCGVGPGDEVITSTFSFFASAGVVSRLGAVPVFADVAPKTFNVTAEQIAKKVTSKTKAIMPVHLYGQTADMDPIMELANSKRIPVVEDAAQAIGAKYKGRKAGTIGRFGCFSFFPSKNLGGLGDGGMVTCNSDGDAELVRKLRVHGSKPKYYHSLVGYNSRLDTLQAAALSVKLKYLESWTEGRRKKASRYNQLLAGLPVEIPFEPEYNHHIYHQYTIAAPKRDDLRKFLTEREIGTEIYYPLPLHEQECYASLGYKKGSLPVAEKRAGEVLSLPVFPELAEGEQDFVAASIREFYRD
ncbi:MAG: DegT/DnrJ/EryC1/StrS family aminotransferase [candidate division Zixibacteria bacterium]|nr:DegT/DnrJ/EryC1/StrS family aminotransferase [candidate division Zixibacteria bacterium]